MIRLERYIEAGGRRLRLGYTTGTCAAAATYAATALLVSGTCPDHVAQDTPAGIRCLVEVEEARAGAGWAQCTVVKDAGDDPDATAGIEVVSTVRLSDRAGIEILGGEGVGRVTRAGLDQPIGEPAINSGPRTMIEAAARAALAAAGSTVALTVTISVPRGVEVAPRTFNGRLGIEGGISILGTTGIVRPMSEAALADTIALELNVAAAAGVTDIVVVPGNIGARDARQALRIDTDHAITCSNLVGATIDAARSAGFASLLLCGHIGKLAKVVAGVWNTHSHTADARAEAVCTHAALQGTTPETLRALMGAATTDAMVSILDEAGMLEATCRSMGARLGERLRERAGADMACEAVVFGAGGVELFRTPGATELVRLHQMAPCEGTYEGARDRKEGLA